MAQQTQASPPLIFLILGALFSFPFVVWRRPPENPGGFSRVIRVLCAVLWVFVPYWLAGSAVRQPLMWPVVAVAAVLGTWAVACAASFPHTYPLADLLKAGWRGLLAHRLITKIVAGLTAAAVIWAIALPLIVLHEPSENPVWPFFPAWLALALPGPIVLGRRHGREVITYVDSGDWEQRIAKILGVPARDLAGRVRALSDGRVIVTAPVSAAARTQAAAMAACATYAPSCVIAQWDPHGQIILEPAVWHPEASTTPVDSAGLIVAEEQIDASPSRPAPAFSWTLADGVKPEQVARYAKNRSLTLVAYEKYADTAVVATVPSQDRAIRDRIADLVGVSPWDVEVTVTWADSHPEVIQIVRLPERAVPIDVEKRASLWHSVIAAMPGTTTGWTIRDDRVHSTTDLVWGPPRHLPDTVPLQGLLADASTWHRLPIGVGESGDPVSIDLELGPHSMIVGPTGSGKTVAIVGLVAQAAHRGFEVVLVDAVKGGLDFLPVRPWLSAMADSMPSALAVLRHAYAEGQRRKEVLGRYGRPKWSDLDSDMRTLERVSPVLVVIDEASSLLLPIPIPKGLPKDSPVLVEAQTLAAQKAEILSLVGKIARELRFAGIHLVLGTQRPDASILGGEMRQNLSTAVQLVAPGKPPSADSLRMVFAQDVVDGVYTTVRDLDDGSHRGLAVLAGEDGSVRAARIGYASTGDLPGLMADVEKPVPWDLSKDLDGDSVESADETGGDAKGSFSF